MNVQVHLIPRGTSISNVVPLSAIRARVLNYCQRLGGDVWTGSIDGRQICCWGLVPPTILSNSAYLWMYFDEDPKSYVDLFVFIRRSQIEVTKMLDLYPTVTGHCEVGNLKAARWLRWLGASLGDPVGDLRPFTIRRSHG